MMSTQRGSITPASWTEAHLLRAGPWVPTLTDKDPSLVSASGRFSTVLLRSVSKYRVSSGESEQGGASQRLVRSPIDPKSTGRTKFDI
ncbi:hypothetical protein MPTK1_5g20080 [Marchantia polymorpha subsp. ruderalis]|uniref:Uncharacterized protein n=2 Tax=Marchantia polymorpha TaxID=3197 RepID=A0AAF6BKA6_MARPO|nr:hypothetical protein MARPO_0190s0004 [Marchantia polymorpha]BBN12440.1 hypothetical protein Mp_5g20080 [Marchantia polymorpha subsp. ruderalis]|eukprot:PTQ27607.1 hypothetical protein MARPO_0190s0004 [Marchantia polymorpha]